MSFSDVSSGMQWDRSDFEAQMTSITFPVSPFFTFPVHLTKSMSSGMQWDRSDFEAQMTSITFPMSPFFTFPVHLTN